VIRADDLAQILGIEAGKQAALARTNRVEGVMDRVGGIENLVPVGGAVPLCRRSARASTSPRRGT
jgi:hypothetical protein